MTAREFMRDWRGRYRLARIGGLPWTVAAWRAWSTLAIETLCDVTVGHEYRWVNGSLECWMCDASKPHAPGQHAGGDG